MLGGMREIWTQVAADLQAIENPYVAFLVDRPYLALILVALLARHLINDEKLRRRAKAEGRYEAGP